jgi:two-component system response regulator QseB
MQVPRSPHDARVLLVEDDPDLVGLLTRLLSDEGYQVESAQDGHRGLHLGLTRRYDMMILDRGLPAVDGLDLLGRLRGKGMTTPVLILSALGNPADRVAGLDAGAEDYLAKPFDVEKLLARLRALRRRHLDTARTLPLGDRRLDLDTRLVLPGPGLPGPELPAAGWAGAGVAAAPVRLSERECGLLAVLASRPTRVFSRAELLALVFPDAETEIVVDTYVHYLRRKLGRGVVATVRGRGYQLLRSSQVPGL